MYFFFFKQKTAYALRISDWSSDVCSSDLNAATLDFLRPYDALKPVNVEGSRNILAFAAAGRPKRVAHVSSISVLETPLRSEERRVGKECVSTCRSRWSPYH